MGKELEVVAKPTESGWLLQCVEHPEAISQVEDLTTPFVIREAIALATGQPENTFTICLSATTDLLTLNGVQTSNGIRSLYWASLRSRRNKNGRAALTEWVLGVLRYHAAETPAGAVLGASFTLRLDSGREVSFPRFGSYKLPELLDEVSDSPALTAWFEKQQEKYYRSSGHRGKFFHLRMHINDYREVTKPQHPGTLLTSDKPQAVVATTSASDRDGTTGADAVAKLASPKPRGHYEWNGIPPSADRFRPPIQLEAPASPITEPAKALPIWIELSYADGTQKKMRGFAMAWTPEAVYAQWIEFSRAREAWVLPQQCTRRQLADDTRTR